MAATVLTDSGFWIGLLDPADQYHQTSNTIAEMIEGYQILFPWPCLYETISTRLVRRRQRVLILEEFIQKPYVTLFDDTDYKLDALEEVFNLNRIAGYTYSLTDGVVREILKDINVRVNFLVTFNGKDFHDICQRRQIEIVSY